MLERLIRFAAARRGAGVLARPARHVRKRRLLRAVAEYIEQVFPRQASRSRLGREARLDLTIGIEVRGPGGGQWSCTWSQGELLYLRPGLIDGATVVYHTDTATFNDVSEW